MRTEACRENLLKITVGKLAATRRRAPVGGAKTMGRVERALWTLWIKSCSKNGTDRFRELIVASGRDRS